MGHLPERQFDSSMLSFYTTALFWSQKWSNGANVEVHEILVNTGTINGCQRRQKTIFDLDVSSPLGKSLKKFDILL